MKIMLNRLREFFKQKKERSNHLILHILMGIIKQNKDKYNLSDVVGVLAGIIGLAAYCAISPALAKYRGTQALLWAAQVAIGVMILILIWELLCIVASVNRKKMKVLFCILHNCLKKHWRLGLISLCVFFSLFVIFNPPIKIEYYTDITEVYGVPAGVGEISKEDLENRVAYWKIEDYKWFKCIVLTYVEPYGQMEVMKENSSAYSMALFPVTARIVCKYSTDQEEYRMRLDEEAFTSAAEAGILRAPVCLSYFSSSGKLLLRLEQTGFGRAKITAYSSDEMPQLPGSTLLRVPDGQSAGNEMTSLQIETTYRPDGQPASRRLFPYIYNQYGVNGERYTYNEKGQISVLCYLDVNGEPVCNKLGIMSISLSYSAEDDTLRSIRYFSDQDCTEKTEGFYGVFCERFEYDGLGNLTDRWELDRSESWCYDKDGVYSYHYYYDEGRLIREEFLGRENTPVESSRFHTSVISYDLSQEGDKDMLSICYGVASVIDEGEPVSAQLSVPDELEQPIYTLKDIVPTWIESTEDAPYLSALSQTNAQLPALREEQGIAPTEGQNDLDAEENSVRSYATMRYSINSGNRQVSAIRYCNRAGEPTESEDGYYEKRLRYDNQARIEREFYYDAEKKPCLNADGYASVKRSYDGDGRIEKITYLGLDDMPIATPERGYASLLYSYSSLDNKEIIRTSYCDILGKPVQPASLGYAMMEQRYNESGLLEQEAYYNADEAPAYRLDYRVAAISYEYSDSGDLIHESYRDAEGLPINRADVGYAVIHQTFDRGQVVQRSYEGYVERSLQPVPDRTTGAAVIKYCYQNGKIQREDYYGPDGEEHVLRRDTGYAACEYEYENGLVSAQHFYGPDGAPVLSGDHGCAHKWNGYNELGQLETIRYTGLENEPIISTYYHCAGFNYGYDDQGNRSYICYVGLDDEPLLRSDLGYAQLRRVYQKDKISKEWYMDTNGASVLCKEGGYARSENRFDPNGNWVEGRYYDADNNLTLRSDRGYAVVKFTYNNGRRITERFYDTDGKTLVISTYYHCAGFDYGYDKQGNRSDISYIGLDEKKMIRSDLGYAQVKKTFEDGNIVKEEFFDVSGSPTPCKDGGNASYTSVYENGNWMESRYYDTEGKPMLMNYGYAFIKNTYDEFGQMLSSRFYDTDEETLVISSKYHCAGLDYEYDSQGNETHVNYIELDGNLMLGAGLGYAQVEKTYDAMGNLIGEAYFDVDGNPVVNKDQGYASYKRVYENGLWTATRYYNADDQLTPCKEGYAVLINEYNDCGQRILQQYYGIDGETPVVSAEYHCAAIRYGYDERGNTNYYGYLDPDGELMIRSDYGYAQVKKTFNDRDELKGEVYLDTAGQAATYKDRGYAAFEQTYEDGLLREIRYLNPDKEPVVRADEGYAIVHYKYDSFGQEESIRYYNIDGETPVINTYYHCAGFDYGYDDRGNRSDISYIGLEKEPLIRSDLGYARINRIYCNGKITSESYFDADGNPIPDKEHGYASFENDYDVSGNCIESRFYDSYHNLIMRKDMGYAVERNVYDDLGHCISNRYYGIDGETPVISTYYHCAGFDYECDALGNRIIVRYIGLDEELMIRSDLGFAQNYRTFDEMGRLIAEAYRDVDGNPAADKVGGYVSYKDSYDTNGNLIETKYYDDLNLENLTRRLDTGYAVIRNEYDVFNQLKSQYYYDTDGETLVVSSKYYCAGMLLDYDENGNQTDIRYISPNKEPMMRSDLGFARVMKVYDGTGQLTGEKYFDVDEDEQQVTCNDGYASYESIYENGLWMQSTYFDIYGNPVVQSDRGYAVVRNTYDEYGRLATQRYYDKDGDTPIVSSMYHCIGYDYSYDERGNQNYKWYIEPDKTIAVHSGSDLLNFIVYDEYYHVVRDAYYIFEDDEPVLVSRKDLDYAGIQNVYEGTIWVKTVYFDENEQPIINQDKGYAVLIREFNDRWQLVKVSYYDETGEPTECKAGYAVVEYEYDKSGNKSDWIYS